MHIAMAIFSYSKHSTKFPNISISSNYSTKSYIKVSSYISPLTYTHSSSNYTCSKVQENALIIPGQSDVRREQWCNGAAVRRKKRRRRRKSDLEFVYDEGDEVVFGDNKGGRSRVMTPKEEARCSWYLKERARIEAVRAELEADMGGHGLSTSQWAKAAGISQRKLDKILCNGRECEEIITSCYRRLVVSVASSHQGRGLSLRDLTQEGSIGLLHGATKFNPERGYKLSTYAYWWIRQAITRAIAKKSKLIRLPGSISQRVPKICEANNVLSGKLGRFPTYEEIAEAIDVNASVVRLAIERNRSPVSLDQAITTQGCMSLQDIIPGPEEITPEIMVKKDLLKPEIQMLLKPLCYREAQVLRLHYGLNGETPWSFEEIGRLFKLSRERIRQINSSALSKLRKTSQIDDLKYFI
ncbi:hypothetical protein CDL12_03626 [Handroanthus impetiginosus]|uniref:RNA polymerase sigma-70 domain-containing protein n=1 Tax=Handroanthus impetiginosus TaxID=429701 RepID=A0A2G9I1J0_9LAMI|nr:hypothetical protein CDL12_03626 [Handroanthus impetiginosus]